jgi:hypothetical protein
MQHQSKLSPRQSETLFDDSLPESPEKLRDEVAALKSRKRRKRNRQRRWSVLLITGVSVVISLLLMATIFSVRAEYGRWQTRVAQRQAELDALKMQLKTGERRLVALQSPQGRQELLIDNGYLKPGDRYLEFPADADEKRVAALPPNDLTPHSNDWSGSPIKDGSMWRGAWDALAEKWHKLRN